MLILGVLYPPLLSSGQWVLDGQTTLYSTGFEFPEGYVTGYTVAGQNGWIADADGGNGLISGIFANRGQQAFLGFAPFAGSQLNLWHPLPVAPAPDRYPYVRFSVVMAIFDSISPQKDDFRWCVYNASNERLFSLDFDGVTREISYLPQGQSDFVPTGISYLKGVQYDLVIDLDLARNRWSATFDHRLIVKTQPISADSAHLDLGDVNLVWKIRQPGQSGDNYLIFDNLHIVALPVAAASLALEPVLQPLGRSPSGQFMLRLTGDDGQYYTIETSNNWRDWRPLKTVIAGSDGTVDFVDESISPSERQFYRARLSLP